MFFKLIKEYQPISSTGMLPHFYEWASSGFKDEVDHNPAFKKSEKEDSIAIYCTHGTADRPQSFARIASRLLEKGLPETISSITRVAFDGRFQGQGIEYFAMQLMEKIIANKDKRVILMGHSRGGLVNAYLAEYLAINHGVKVEYVFNLATPFKGSTLALAPLSWMSTSVLQMQVESDFLASLNEKIKISQARYYFVEAPDDYIVGEGLSYVPEYVEKNPDSLIKLQRSHGHISMMSSQKLVQTIHDIINRADNFCVSKVFYPIDTVDIIENYQSTCSSSLDVSTPKHCQLSNEDVEESMPGLFDGF